MRSNILFGVFVLCGLINLWAEATSNVTLVFISKPLLMILLGLWLWSKTNLRTRLQKFTFGALIFSCGGDTLLMFVEQGGGEQFFLFGLGSFLIAHIFYSLGFWGRREGVRGFVQEQPVWGIPLILYGALLLIYLYSDIPDPMKVPVIVYSSVIVLMALTALNLSGLVPQQMFGLIMAGVMLFVFSDTLIALSKFKSGQLSPLVARLLIMSLYISGQALIAKGVALDK